MKQLGLALHNYHDTAQTFPPGGFFQGANLGTGMGWHVGILPYIDQAPMFNQFNFNAIGYTNATNLAIALRSPPGFYCPSGRQDKTGNSGERSGGVDTNSVHYYGVMGPKGAVANANPARNYTVITSPSGHGGFSAHGLLPRHANRRMADVIDGTSNTLMVGEISWIGTNAYRVWIRGCDSAACGSTKNVNFGINIQAYTSGNFNDVSFGSQHVGGAHFLNADGSVVFLSQNIDMGVYRALASINGGESVSP